MLRPRLRERQYKVLTSINIVDARWSISVLYRNILKNCSLIQFCESSYVLYRSITLIAGFMGPTWGPSGADRTQVGPCWSHEPCSLGTIGSVIFTITMTRWLEKDLSRCDWQCFMITSANIQLICRTSLSFHHRFNIPGLFTTPVLLIT